jgi:hypothetical protein
MLKEGQLHHGTNHTDLKTGYPGNLEDIAIICYLVL